MKVGGKSAVTAFCNNLLGIQPADPLVDHPLGLLVFTAGIIVMNIFLSPRILWSNRGLYCSQTGELILQPDR
jgi:hypothetical protein